MTSGLQLAHNHLNVRRSQRCLLQSYMSLILFSAFETIGGPGYNAQLLFDNADCS